MSERDELSELRDLDPMLVHDPLRVGRATAVQRVRITEYSDGAVRTRSDEVAGEEPLEIRLLAWNGDSLERHRIAVTMRTPGADFDLAAGFLLSEGVVRRREDVARIAGCTDPEEAQRFNVVNVELKPGVPLDLTRLTRHVYTTSSCGICGKAALEAVESVSPERPLGTFRLSADYLAGIYEALQPAQSIFSRTGGTHATSLFDSRGALLLRREDVGRHNATDKLVGALLMAGDLPASETTVAFSGRAAFELVQKALIAGIPCMVSVGAPTSLAVDLARRYGATLISFLRGRRFNVYAGHERLDL